jgi:RNA polymerase sigma-70 factor, ECF subfamily
VAVLNAGALAGSDADAATLAFNELVEGRYERAYHLAWLILRNRPDAEDAVHDAYLAAWRARRFLRNADRIDAWFDRIVVNACRDRLRHRRRHPTEEMMSDVPGQSASASASVDDRLAMEAAFSGLSAEHRIVLVLRFYADQTLDQIASVLRVPHGTVKSRIHYALKSLRIVLEESDPEFGRAPDAPR